MKRLHNKGFTIVELMIATTVFSIILMVFVTAIIQVGRIYYKATIQSHTQERARAISEQVAKDLQFGKVSTFSTASGYTCVGGHVYVYNLGNQVGVDPGVGMGVRSTGACSASTVDLTELLGDHMQLTKFNVTYSGGLYKVTIRVVYGNDSDFTGDPATSSCKTISLGGQFCAVSELTTTVTPRLL